ncbi:hypothetical protein TELCIR_04148 [Teladorsagia circumcincta]|uniref:Phosphotransferase n=1 Tax=Teladorsagia circumcincta TaxID=45464 RepID=A0A2G9UWJ1_TELCI|nr:hypothetical protein TELCIR_04148 [Teladorsagia circumcincta]
MLRRQLEQKIIGLINSGIKYQLMLSKDGSGIGTAVVAAVATHIKRERSEKTGQLNSTQFLSSDSNDVDG